MAMTSGSIGVSKTKIVMSRKMSDAIAAKIERVRSNYEGDETVQELITGLEEDLKGIVARNEFEVATDSLPEEFR